ncbi:hypothetical protein [Nonomuraea sp. NPDC049309]|uniref:hypothetical protein n=1 Tax=Nonomuraea sp. NPDC049309 TaxID=3364350 RepID=UPI003713C56A
MVEEALTETGRTSKEVAERLDMMRAAVEQRLDRLSADVAQINRPEQKPASSQEAEELGRLLVKIIESGKFQMHLHAQIAEFVTEETKGGARLAGRKALEASEKKPPRPGVLATFKQLAEDPLQARKRKTESGRKKADASEA